MCALPLKHSTRPSSRPLKDSSQDKNQRKCWRRHAPTSRPVIGLCLLSHAKTQLPMFGFREALSSGVAMEAVRLSFHSRRVDSVFHHEGAAIFVSTLQICGRNGLLQGVPAFRALPFLQRLALQVTVDIHFATDSKATWPAAILLLLAPADISWWRFRVFSMPREFVVSDHRKACRTAPARHASGQGGQQTPGSKMHSRYTNPCGYIRMCVHIYIYMCVCPHTCIRVC